MLKVEPAMHRTVLLARVKRKKTKITDEKRLQIYSGVFDLG